eukprot:GCRY01003758.1.p1 GENE.GCRY01003758.1~~GCRY01003758.1.p1  ORF type:complete len:453 (+),score=74.88 GCRY01003758.1:133-1359(+)
MKLDEVVGRVKHFCVSPEYFWFWALSILALEAVVNPLIINKVAYTEIDWIAYMDEVKGVIEDKNYDYTTLKGDTGPLVYPAGFVYMFSALYHLTDQGTNILLAQYIFAALHVLFLLVVFFIYKHTDFPPYALVFVAFSRRIHSIFVLRLFNDAVAMFLLYIAVALFLKSKWRWGCVMYSLAVSIKMNIFLFAPALFFLLLQTGGVVRTFWRLSLCGVIQVVLGLPFMLENFWGYLGRAFEFSRVFFFKWTVNWRFIPEDIFLSKWFALSLLALHLLLIVVVIYKFLRKERGLKCIPFTAPFDHRLNPEYVVQFLFSMNFLGIVVSRSLHYQFYVWYYHTLPLLLWKSPLPVPVRLLVLGMIEYGWNIYPSTTLSSALLLGGHLVVLTGILLTEPPALLAVASVKKKSN